jgi:predicted RNase H-like nuclease (RuvC/YqgF family)
MMNGGAVHYRSFPEFCGRDTPTTTRLGLQGAYDPCGKENEQLKAHVAELVKESGDLGNRVDALTQENAALKQENEQLKRKAKTKKTKKSKHLQHTSNGQ